MKLYFIYNVLDSARSVAEEIEAAVDEDDDIITPAPTPRVNLASPKPDDAKDTEESKGGKGNSSLDTYASTLALPQTNTDNTLHRSGGGKDGQKEDREVKEKNRAKEGSDLHRDTMGKEKQLNKEESDKSRKGIEDKQQDEKRKKKVSEEKERKDSKDKDSLRADSDIESARNDNEDIMFSSTRSMKLDEIFKTSTRSNVSLSSSTSEKVNRKLEKESLNDATGSYKKDEKSTGYENRKGDKGGNPRPVPRKSVDGAQDLQGSGRFSKPAC